MSSRILSATIIIFLGACSVQQGPALSATTPPIEVAKRKAAPRAVHPAQDIQLLAGLLPAMPEPVTSFGAASDGSHLYVLGGYSGEPHAYSREGQHRELTRLALDGKSPWQKVSELDQGLQGLALVHHAGRLCRVGGTEARNQAGAPADLHSLNEASCFEPKTNSWLALPALPVGRSSHGAAVVGNTLYVVGGWTLSGAAGTGAWQEDVMSLALDDPGAVWRAIKAPFKRRALGVAKAANKLVMVGGITPEGEPSQRVDVFDPNTQSFSRGPDYPSNAFGVSVETLGDAVIASAKDGVVYRWQPGQPAWQAVARLAFQRFFHQLVATSADEVIAVGGISGMHNEGRSTHVERVALGSSSAHVVAWSMAYPGQAKNRQGVFVHGDYVYLFGGNNSLGQHDFDASNFVDQSLRLHLPSLQLAEVAPFPARRQTMQTVSGETKGVALGGFGHDGEKAVSFAEGYDFDFDSEQWSKTASMPESRTQFGLTAHGGELWVFGGLNFDPSRTGPEQFHHLTNLLHGKPELGSVFGDAGVSLPAARRAFAGAAQADDYFLLGGMRGGFELVDDCLRYSFKTRSFSPLSCPAQARLSAALVPVFDKLYLVGGSVRGAAGDNGLVSAQEVLELDPQNPTYRAVLTHLPFEPRHMHAVAFQDRVLLISTHNTDGRIYVALIDPVLRGVAPAPRLADSAN